jgi:DNA-directed RNA polymerase I, II, and III subunit RPABC2
MSSYFDDDDEFDKSLDSSEDEEEYVKPSIISKKEIKTIHQDDSDEEDPAQFGGVVDFLEDEDDDDDDEDDDDIENTEINKEQKNVKLKQIPENAIYNETYDDDDEDDGVEYLKKFDKEVNKNYIMNFHPECILQNYDEIECLTKIVRDKDGIIIDNFHRTIPYLTKYERTRILGQRAKQINSDSPVFVKVPENVIDGYLIAELELEQKRIPFIIRRPLPNGGSEYWNVKDLENIGF